MAFICNYVDFVDTSNKSERSHNRIQEMCIWLCIIRTQRGRNWAINGNCPKPFASPPPPPINWDVSGGWGGGDGGGGGGAQCAPPASFCLYMPASARAVLWIICLRDIPVTAWCQSVWLTLGMLRSSTSPTVTSRPDQRRL